MKRTVFALTALAAGVAFAAQAEAQQLRFMTGPQGGAWYPLGGAIQAMASDAGIASIQVVPGGGIANVQGVQNGETDFGFGNTISTVDAVNGREPFSGPADNVCNVATLYPQYFQMVVPANSGIETVDDLRGKRIVTQPVGNTAEQVMRAILETAGMSYEDMAAVDYVSYSDGVSLVQDGNAHAFTLGTTIPSSAVMDLANSTDIKLLPLTDEFVADMRALNPGYAPITIPAGTYPGQGEDVLAVGYATHIVARCDLDADIVHGILNEMWENREDLVAIASAVRDMTLEGMAFDIGVPFHEGAERFYTEQGVM
jgi:uncharacterized protein